MFVQELQLGPLQSNCWLVAADAESPLVVIDPAAEADVIEQVIGDREVAAIVLTHGHFDHISAAAELAASTGAPLMVGERDAYRLESTEASGAAMFGFEHATATADRLLREGDALSAGALTLTVLETPGHTEGSISLIAEEPGEPAQLFCGDTVFAGSIGRSDLEGGDPYVLRQSISRLATLGGDTLVHPGHGPDTTIARELRLNPFFPRA